MRRVSIVEPESGAGVLLFYIGPAAHQHHKMQHASNAPMQHVAIANYSNISLYLRG